MKNTAFLIVVFALAGCATKTITPKMIDGSKADGLVTYSYEQYGLQKIEPNVKNALDDAIRRCSNWGYSSADVIASISSTCHRPGMFGCMRTQYFYRYQCVD